MLLQGFTLGYESVDSLIVIDTPDAVKAFTSSSFAIDADVGMGVGKLAGQVRHGPLLRCLRQCTLCPCCDPPVMHVISTAFVLHPLQAVGMPLTIPLSDDAAPDSSLQWSIAKGVYADISFKSELQPPLAGCCPAARP